MSSTLLTFRDLNYAQFELEISDTGAVQLTAISTYKGENESVVTHRRVQFVGEKEIALGKEIIQAIKNYSSESTI